MGLLKKIGYAVATDGGALLCKGCGFLYLDPFPMSGDSAGPFIVCEHKSGAEGFAREWNEQTFRAKSMRVKPVKVVVEIRPFSREAAGSER